jgi:capsular polysaccharide biosynthesis protein
LDVRQLMWLVRDQFLALVAITLAGAVSAFVVSSQLPTAYEAKASLIAQTMASTYAEVAQSRPVLEYTITTLELPVTPEELAESVDAIASQTSALLTISARDGEAAVAAAIASTIANRLVELAPGISGSSAEAQQAIQDDLARVQNEIDVTEDAIAALAATPDLTPIQRQQLQAQHDQLASLLAVRASLQSVAISYSENVLTVLALAATPTEPVSPRVTLATAVGGVVGLIVGLSIIYLRGYLRMTAKPEPSWPVRK